MRLAALLPWVRHRQWTLSLPFKLRFLMVKRPELLKRLELRLVRAVWRWQRAVARRLGVSGPFRGGAVVFTQWFGSSLQVTPHLHGLVAEALWTPTGELVELPAPDTAEVEGILVRVLRGAQKDFSDLEAPWPFRRVRGCAVGSPATAPGARAATVTASPASRGGRRVFAARGYRGARQ